MAPEIPDTMHIYVVQSLGPREVREVDLTLPAGATVKDALRQTGWLGADEAAWEGLSVGVWGRKCALEHVLRDRDRVEIYRLLTVDPKVARRERFQRQGARAAGLFNRRRPGGKPGY